MPNGEKAQGLEQRTATAGSGHDGVCLRDTYKPLEGGSVRTGEINEVTKRVEHKKTVNREGDGGAQ